MKTVSCAIMKPLFTSGRTEMCTVMDERVKSRIYFVLIPQGPEIMLPQIDKKP